EGGLLFYRKNSGLERQSRVFVRRSVDAEPSLLLDPNAMFPDGSVSLGQVAPSPDGALVAYTLSEGGADWQTVHVRDIATGRDRPDSVRWMRFSGLSWTKDGKGFFYSRYPEPPEGKALEAALTGHAIYYHRVGTPQSADRLIYERKDLPTWFVFGSVTEDGRYLLVSISRGADNTNRLYAAGLGDPLHPNVAAPVRPVVELDGAEYSPVGSDGSTVFVRSDADAPNRKILAIELRDPRPVAWRTIVPEGQQAIEGASVIGGRLVLQYLDDVKSRVRFFSLRGEAEGELALPGVGTVVGISGRQDSPELFYAYTSPLYPTTVFSYDAASGRSTPFEAATPPIDVDRYETKQLFATSKDGTRIPFFLTMRRDLKRDGANPTLLYAYGGFSVSLTPSFSPSVPAWLELGGIYVTANLRGGGEYGEAWHRAGMLDRKQNVFDDFIAVAEYLVKEGYTSPARLGIEGGSNGGLLVGAAMEQRPDLFAVAFPGVGVMDMLRYDRFTGGRAWVTEYGSSSDRAQFETLFRYSPLHNIRTGVCYPATLVTTADHDDRVVPSHSFKFVATLQRAQACARPVLVRVETQGSHGYRPTDKRIAEIADIYAFAAAQTGMKAPLPRP
ncbi:MAG TPA: prolyl oligopeptidase family serine peptidase, partial [Gemmatimonadaceae bacterium]|nr:prolyl oligopeptidase family serine peptidase [Gemmatimonadaceae bacterium]